MGSDEEKKIFIDAVQQKVNDLSKTTQKRDWFKIYSIYFFGTLILLSLVWLGTKVQIGIDTIRTWNGYGAVIETKCDKSEVESHEKSDAVIHKAQWAESHRLDSLISNISFVFLTQTQRNQIRANYNDTVKIHEP